MARLLNAFVGNPPFCPLVVPGWCFVVESFTQSVDLPQVETTDPKTQCSEATELDCVSHGAKKLVCNEKVFHFALTSQYDGYRSNPSAHPSSASKKGDKCFQISLLVSGKKNLISTHN